MSVHKELEEAYERVLKLEEQLAYMEQARDNALTMRDEAQKQKKQSGESAARRIEALIQLAREYAVKLSPYVLEDGVFNTLEKFDTELAAILEKHPYTLAESNLVEKSKEPREVFPKVKIDFFPFKPDDGKTYFEPIEDELKRERARLLGKKVCRSTIAIPTDVVIEDGAVWAIFRDKTNSYRWQAKDCVTYEEFQAMKAEK